MDQQWPLTCNMTQCSIVKAKGKVVPYTLPSIGPGANHGVTVCQPAGDF